MKYDKPLVAKDFIIVNKDGPTPAPIDVIKYDGKVYAPNFIKTDDPEGYAKNCPPDSVLVFDKALVADDFVMTNDGWLKDPRWEKVEVVFKLLIVGLFVFGMLGWWLS